MNKSRWFIHFSTQANSNPKFCVKILSHMYHRSVAVDSFFDYTYFQNVFGLSTTNIPRVEEVWGDAVVPAGGIKTIMINPKVVKMGTVQDLPAKIGYKILDGHEGHISWSTTNGKMAVGKSHPVANSEDGSMRGMRVMWFGGLACLNILLPVIRFHWTQSKYFKK